MNDSNTAPRQTRLLTSLTLLWLAGCGLRLTILAVPPVIPLIHDELNLSATQIGILTGLPSMLFAFAAVPGSLLIARLGVRTRLAAEADRFCNGGLHQRSADRRNPACRADASLGAADGRRKLATRLRRL